MEGRVRMDRYGGSHVSIYMQVVCMNVYDIALDFVLLDAFDDLENPPGAVVAVLQNRWITAGMKTSVSTPHSLYTHTQSLQANVHPYRPSLLQYGPSLKPRRAS